MVMRLIRRATFYGIKLPKRSSPLDCASEAIWIKDLVTELKIQPDLPINIHCDNKGAVDFSKNGNFSHGLKHVMVHYHFIKELVKNKKIQVFKIPGTDMIADCLTKALPATPLKKFLPSLGLG